MTERELHDLEREARALVLRRLSEDVVEGNHEAANSWAAVYGALTFDDLREAAVTEPAA